MIAPGQRSDKETCPRPLWHRPSPTRAGKAGRDHQSFVDRRLGMLLEVAQQTAGRDSGMPAWLFVRVSTVSSSASGRLIDPTSFAVASATSRLPCSSARRKTVREWPCEVDAPPPRGRGRRTDLERPHVVRRFRMPRMKPATGTRIAVQSHCQLSPMKPETRSKKVTRTFKVRL
jgi:hypothetical protein